VFTVYSVGITQTRIAFEQATRTALVVLNNSANLVYVGAKGQDLNGWPISGGGSISLKIPEDNPREELWAISVAPGSDVRVYEGFG